MKSFIDMILSLSEGNITDIKRLIPSIVCVMIGEDDEPTIDKHHSDFFCDERKMRELIELMVIFSFDSGNHYYPTIIRGGGGTGLCDPRNFKVYRLFNHEHPRLMIHFHAIEKVLSKFPLLKNLDVLPPIDLRTGYQTIDMEEVSAVDNVTVVRPTTAWLGNVVAKYNGLRFPLGVPDLLPTWLIPVWCVTCMICDEDIIERKSVISMNLGSVVDEINRIVNDEERREDGSLSYNLIKVWFWLVFFSCFDNDKIVIRRKDDNSELDTEQTSRMKKGVRQIVNDVCLAYNQGLCYILY